MMAGCFQHPAISALSEPWHNVSRSRVPGTKLSTMTDPKPPVAKNVHDQISQIVFGIHDYDVSGHYYSVGGLHWQPQVSASVIIPAPAPRPANQLVHENSTGSDGEFAKLLLERPLFLSNRHKSVLPIAERVEIQADPGQNSPLPSVYGIASSGKTAIAIVSVTDEGRQMRLTVGDTIAGWTVAAIRTNSVEFYSLTRAAVVSVAPQSTRRASLENASYGANPPAEAVSGDMVGTAGFDTNAVVQFYANLFRYKSSTWKR
jgi:hypothetical protein